MDLYLGIDIGSTTTKIVLMDEEGLMGSRVQPTGVHCGDTVERALQDLLHETGRKREDIRKTVATGYGRRLIPFADEVISEITANVRGTSWSCSGLDGPVRTILNIGGQDSKVIAVDSFGVTENFAMNDKCAAGTGRFLETVARILEMNMADLGPLSLEAEIPLKINATCAVFAESEIISLIARKKAPSEIAAGAHYAIARRLVRMARRVGITEPVAFDGGPALNKGLVKAIEDELAVDIHVPAWPQITTAIGAALLARDAHMAAAA
ncbi:acyl-CoA dehydratase activase [Desulfobotulus sp. H1]|uniref:Acyl-CoA dehydratase activase n=1 Tax=Desulfobotulus pelophilus TaxID=2823377 RepID=A0ABT3N968_9BACT|nr:acyl-CoA dehydratase activase [Desulfobotulus pelophilus]MCW7754010.1 acyl-CoA dehydratase activase [Desulfobotulus pelophilus]